MESKGLKWSDLSIYFHLSIVDAAKKLGICTTNLKKECRKFGVKRWPGRKVRNLESTIHGLEHTIAVGKRAGMAAYMRSEVTKLQQVKDQLLHSTPAQVIRALVIHLHSHTLPFVLLAFDGPLLC
jgi:hypothetical protein